LKQAPDFEIFLSAPPGLESLLLAETLEAGFADAHAVAGGVVFRGGWPEVWRANLTLRGPSKVLVRIGEFRAFHLAQLDKRARKFPWGDILNPAYSVKAEVVTNRKSKIYHAGAEISRRLLAGRSRRFAFEKLTTFDPLIVDEIKGQWNPQESPHRFYGSDRNVNVIGFSKENARRAGVEDICHFEPKPLSMITRPEGPPGLVIVNPPYGARVGKKKDLHALYSAFGDVMRERFKGWRVGMVTADHHLAQAAKLPWKGGEAPIAHGGLRVKLYRTEAL